MKHFTDPWVFQRSMTLFGQNSIGIDVHDILPRRSNECGLICLWPCINSCSYSIYLKNNRSAAGDTLRTALCTTNSVPCYTSPLPFILCRRSWFLHRHPDRC